MANIFRIMGVLGSHPALVQWATGKIPEALAMVKEVQDFLKRHEVLLKEAQKHAPEFQQLITEMMPLFQPDRYSHQAPGDPSDPFSQLNTGDLNENPP